MSATTVATATGRFVWRELMSTDPDRAKAFYTELFGWTVHPTAMGEMGTYDLLRNGETDFGGIVSLGAERGTPSHWLSSVTVASVDEATAKAAALGGTVAAPPTDIPGVGRFAVVGDPQGATFAPFTPLPDLPDATAPERVPPVGGVAWNELATSDVEGAKAFYGEVVGWGFERADMGGPEPYTIIKRGDQMEAGLMKKPDEVPISTWVVYFHVADLDQTLADITRLGGQPFGPIIDVPTVGRVSWATDPTGAVFALHEPLK
jgi:predicted enzyme related to lactoylglutathione lyase